MPNGIEIPIRNPYRFVELNKPLNPLYHIPAFDEDWFQNSILPHERRNQFRDVNNPVYKALIQSNQPVCIQVAVPEDISSISLKMMSCSGTLTTVGSTYLRTATKDGDVYDNHGSITPIQQKRYQWTFTPTDIISTATGLYYFLITVVFADTEEKQYISEPNNIQADHPGTVYIEYSHSSNDHDIFFDMSTRFGVRLDGWIKFKTRKSKRVSYVDEMTNTRQLSSRSFRVFELTTGGKTGLAPYHVDRLSAIFDCNITFIEGIQYVREGEEDEFKVNEFKNYPLVVCTGELCEYWPEDAGKMYGGGVLELYELSEAGTDYPYAISRLSLGMSVPGPLGSTAFVGLDLIPGGIKEIMNQTAETAFIASLNSTIAPLYGLTGTFSNSSGTLVYSNGSGENYKKNESIVYKDVLTIGLSPASTLSFETVLTGLSGVESIVSVWEDDISPAVVVPPARYISTISTVSVTLGAGDYKYYVYTNNRMTIFRSNNASNIEMTSIEGKVSSVLKEIRLEWFDIAALNLDFLLPAADTLQVIRIRNGNVTSLDLGIWSDIDLTVPHLIWPFQNMAYVDFAFESLNESELDNIYNTFWTYVAKYIARVGTIVTANQTTTDTPGAGSSLSRSALMAKGWTIVT